MLLPNGADPRWYQDALTFVNRLEADARGTTWIVVTAHNHAATQLRQAKEAIDGGVKVLVVAPVNPDSAAQIVTYARPRGVRVIAYDRPIEAKHLSLFVGYDPAAVGRMQERFVVGHISTGNIICINGPFTDDIASSQFSAFDGLRLRSGVASGQYALTKYWMTSWSSGAAYNATVHGVFTAQKHVAAIVAQDDVLAGGAIDAITRFRPPLHTLLTGAGSSLSGLRAVLLGTQSMTAFEPGRLEAIAAADAAIAELRHKPAPAQFSRQFVMRVGKVRAALFSPILIDRPKSIERKIIAPGFVGRSRQDPLNVRLLCAGISSLCAKYKIR